MSRERRANRLGCSWVASAAGTVLACSVAQASPWYSVFEPQTKFFRYGNWGGGGWSNSGNGAGTAAPGVDAMDAAFKQHDINYGQGNSTLGNTWAGAPSWQKPIWWTQWAASRMIADETLYWKLFWLPNLNLYANGSDSWGYKIATYGTMPKSRTWRLGMRSAAMTYVFLPGPMIPPPW